MRKQAGWTQQQLATRLGIKRSKVGAFEEFRALPKVTDAVKIARVFGVNLDSLIASDMSKRILKRTG